jgi:hypothetical protein
MQQVHIRIEWEQQRTRSTPNSADKQKKQRTGGTPIIDNTSHATSPQTLSQSYIHELTHLVDIAEIEVLRVRQSVEPAHFLSSVSPLTVEMARD